MTDKPIKLSDTARAMLTLARTREDRLVPPPTLPVAAARQVVRSLLNNAMIEEIELPAELAEFFWREGDDGMRLGLRATEQGLAAIAHAVEVPQELAAFTQAVLGFLAEEGCNASILQDDDPRTMIADGHSNGRSAAQVAGDIVGWLEETEADAEEAEAVPAQGSVSEAVAGATGEGTAAADTTAIDAGSPGNALHAAGTPPVRVSLRQAAEAVLAVWADEGNRTNGISTALEAPIAALQAALGSRTIRATSSTPRPPREGTKQSKVLEMLRRPEGATVAQIAEAMQWAPHTVRGFFAGLKKRQGINAVPERVRQAGPEGAKGSHTIYRIAEAN